MAVITTHAKDTNGAGIERRRHSSDIDWSLLSAQGKVLFHVALCPKCSVQEAAAALGLTDRAVWGIIRDLRQTRHAALKP